MSASDDDYEGLRRLGGHPAVAGLRGRMLAGGGLVLGGLHGPALPFVVGLLAEGLGRPCVLVLADGDDVPEVLAELRTWTRETALHAYPEVPAGVSGLEHAALLQQMRALRAMMEPGAARCLWVSTPAALEAPCFGLDFIDQPVLSLERGGSWALEDLSAELERRGFHREDRVEQKGDYAVRGGIVDVHPRFAQHPVRLEFLGRELETIREFSAVTQRSIRHLQRFVLDDLDLSGLQGLVRDRAVTDYLPAGAVFLVQEPHLAGRTLPGGAPATALVQALLADGPCAHPAVSCRVAIGAGAEGADLDFGARLLEPDALSLEGAARRLDQLAAGAEAFLLSDCGSSLGLGGMCRAGIWSLEGPLDANFALPSLGVVVCHERNLVLLRGEEGASREQAVADFLELELGDTVVHEEYGLGRFLGLHSLEKGGETGDYLLLQFAGDTKIYVSVKQLHLVQKYIGRGEGAPELSRIGTRAWELKKKRARRAIDRIVMEIVDRQAFRATQGGHAFAPDGREQRAFERAFPFTETPCQAEAAAAIKRDLEQSRPMDHLLCGDVGFGKTEVAMRAAHKAVLGGKQVALLAPTTVLAEQHYRSFAQRFGDKAHLLGVVSRFHTPGENHAVLARVAAGELMVLVGTHRLLSQDVEFKDLGLLILDEEQRFGVKQKERVKERHPAVHVLSMSATPIPRTLHMSLLGIRGISNLTLPPENRLAIRTYVREWSEGVIRHALERELARGGQAYYLHNRVEDMEEVRQMLARMFPAARIAVGHGQMPERELSAVMQAFYDKQVDIFLATSIVANGIDMPSANTMVIDNAHLFGLSELHQIRGRIGRYSVQAYAYLLLPGGELPQKSLRRLKAIEEHQDLGAGFKLAMRDMEIRGVGNILGEDQHGQIADIGYELYTQYLAQAIEETKGGKGPPLREAEVSWPVGSACLAAAYVPSHADRIGFYRRISFARFPGQLDRVEAELRDRFGPPPRATQNLLRLFRAKVRLLRLEVKSLRAKEGGEQAVLEPFGWSDDLKLAWVTGNAKELAFLGEEKIILRLPRIWGKLEGSDHLPEPVTRYSYAAQDRRLEPLEVLETAVDFCERTILLAKKALEEAARREPGVARPAGG